MSSEQPDGAPTSPTVPRPAARYFWARRPSAETGRGGATDGAALAALRRGIGREPGTVPQMWPYYTTLTADGRVTPALAAEHVALTLFAVHQQSKAQLMHRDGVGLGTALGNLRADPQRSQDALDRRFSAGATASSTSELELHLRGLVALLRQSAKAGGQPLDYTELMRDLVAWQRPDGAARIRRKWGAQYFAPTRSEAPGGDDGADGAASSNPDAAVSQ